MAINVCLRLKAYEGRLQVQKLIRYEDMFWLHCISLHWHWSKLKAESLSSQSWLSILCFQVSVMLMLFTSIPFCYFIPGITTKHSAVCAGLRCKTFWRWKTYLLGESRQICFRLATFLQHLPNVAVSVSLLYGFQETQKQPPLRLVRAYLERLFGYMSFFSVNRCEVFLLLLQHVQCLCHAIRHDEDWPRCFKFGLTGGILWIRRLFHLHHPCAPALHHKRVRGAPVPQGGNRLIHSHHVQCSTSREKDCVSSEWC